MKKKIVVIGDVHGRSSWKDIVKRHPNCMYVFLGDYNDPQECEIIDQEVLINFRRIINFKLSQPNDTILLLGNHDIHYCYNEAPISSRYNPQLAVEFKLLYDEFWKCFQFAYQIENILFTHAGITEDWFTHNWGSNSRENIANQLNNVDENQMTVLTQCGKSRGGDSLYGGIFWADESELNTSLQGYIQIVGHNRVQNVKQVWNPVFLDTGIIFCDCLLHGNYLIIDLELKGKKRFRNGNINID